MNTWLKKGEGYPNWLKMTDMDKHKEYKLTPKQYNGLYENVNLFLIKNGRYPNYATLDTMRVRIVWLWITKTKTTPAVQPVYQWLANYYSTTNQSRLVPKH